MEGSTSPVQQGPAPRHALALLQAAHATSDEAKTAVQIAQQIVARDFYCLPSDFVLA